MEMLGNYLLTMMGIGFWLGIECANWTVRPENSCVSACHAFDQFNCEKDRKNELKLQKTNLKRKLVTLNKSVPLM